MPGSLRTYHHFGKFARPNVTSQKFFYQAQTKDALPRPPCQGVSAPTTILGSSPGRTSLHRNSFIRRRKRMLSLDPHARESPHLPPFWEVRPAERHFTEILLSGAEKG